MPDILTVEPVEIVAGDTVQWSKSFDDYPASDSWTLSYALVKDGELIKIADSLVTSSGDSFLVKIPATVSAQYSPGEYRWQSYVSNPPDRYMVGSGIITIKPDFATQTTGYDPRSLTKKTLDALEATLLKKASKDQLAMTLPTGVKIERMSPAELLVWRDKLKVEYEAELKAEQLSLGIGGSGRKILTRLFA